MANKNKLHAIMIPLPHQGHINPSMNLAVKLASKGFVITFINLEFVHQMMSKSHNSDDLFSEAHKSGLDIRYKTISDGLPLDYDRGVHLIEFWEVFLRDFPARVDKFIGKIIEADPDLVHFLLADTLYEWAAAVAKKYNLVNVSLWTQPALVFSLVYHVELLKENGHFPSKDDVDEEINYIPGIKSINTKDLATYLKEFDIKGMAPRIVFGGFKQVNKTDFILHNTVQELEIPTLSALNKHQPHYAIGPVNFSKYSDTNTVTKSLWSESDCTHWLDSKPPGSVLYVSFGSLVHMDKKIIEEIAYGLLLSEVNFIWVVRSNVTGSAEGKILPDGYEDEIKDKGLIIPWCNQIMLLSNPTVGGFLTHCGWNSTLESIWCGTPMICYPLMFDQPVCRKLLVDDWKIGMNLCNGNSVTREEVAQNIKKFMSGPLAKGSNQEITKVRDQLQNAVEIDGSSEKNLDQFIRDLKAKIDSTATNTEALASS